MARRKRKMDAPMVELNLTAMVDVAFQLLIFFIIISAAPKDQFTNLNMTRAGAPTETAGEEPPPPAAQVMIAPDGIMINDSPVSPRQMEDVFQGLARVSKSERVLIMTSVQSKHEQLIEVLDMCEKSAITNLSIMSTE